MQNLIMKKHYFILALILFLTFLLRFPSLFEPFWYGDEGIFAAVARNLNQGGVLYQTAWDNKPPMIYLTYQAIFNVFGVSMFWLRLITTIVVLATAAAIYEIGQKILGTKKTLVATAAFGFLTSLRLIEGNLALTEIFMILPISLAMFVAIKRNFDYISLFVAGGLLAIASLYKQVGALEAAALGIFLFLYSEKFGDFFKKGLVLSSGFAIPFLFFILYFAPKNLVGEFMFAAYTYYQIYLGESPKYALLINILKFLPILAVIGYGLWKKFHINYSSSESSQTRRVEKSTDGSSRQTRTVNRLDNFHLILLWLAFSSLGSFFSGRTYGHYLVGAVPSLSIIIASVSLAPTIRKVQIFFAIFFFIPLIFLTKLQFGDFLSGGPINQIAWWRNFSDFSQGKNNADDYNNFFDGNVNRIMEINDFLKVQNALGASCYIWGDWPWLYAIADLKNPSRYVTSFHVFGVPGAKEEVSAVLMANPPVCIIKPPTSIGYFSELEKLLAQKYTFGVKIFDSQVYFAKDN